MRIEQKRWKKGRKGGRKRYSVLPLSREREREERVDQ